MGNELSNNDGVLRDDTELGKYVKNFLINKHKLGNDNRFKNYLKKKSLLYTSSTGSCFITYI